MDVELVIDVGGSIDGLRLHKVVEGIAVHETPLHLPVRGTWTVLWGGDTREANRHADDRCQRFAIDLVVHDAKGLTHGGDGSRNEDYLAFGRDVLAPADGVVTEVWSGVADNPPGSPNPYAPFGNAIFLRHRDGEVSVLAHLRRGSLRVSPGDEVARGDVLAACGNSGDSAEPHLHHHLQDGPSPRDATGIRLTFRDVVLVRGSEEEPKETHSPVRGESLRSADA